MFESINKIELEFVKLCRSQENDTAELIMGVIYEGGGLPDGGRSLRLLLSLIESFGKKYTKSVEPEALKEYELLKSCYGNVPISKFEGLIERMFEKGNDESKAVLFFDSLLSKLPPVKREHYERSLFHLYASDFFIEKDSLPMLGGFVLNNSVLPLKQSLFKNAEVGLYDVFKSPYIRKLINKINEDIEYFYIERSFALIEYKQLKGKSEFYDAVYSYHRKA